MNFDENAAVIMNRSLLREIFLNKQIFKGTRINLFINLDSNLFYIYSTSIDSNLYVVFYFRFVQGQSVNGEKKIKLCHKESGQ